MLMACSGISSPASVGGAVRVAGTELPGARGLTIRDQDKIDATVARICGAGGYNQSLCAEHTRASFARRQALRAAAATPQPGGPGE